VCFIFVAYETAQTEEYPVCSVFVELGNFFGHPRLDQSPIASLGEGLPPWDYYKLDTLHTAQPTAQKLVCHDSFTDIYKMWK